MKFLLLLLTLVPRLLAAAACDVNLIAGTLTPGYSGDGGPAVAANLNGPSSLAVDSAGNIYLADKDNYRIRKILAANGNITTVAGTGVPGFNGDGPGLSTQLGLIYGLRIDGSDNVYFCDTGNNRIRKLDSFGNVTTVAGTGAFGFGGDGGPARLAAFANPGAIALEQGGAILVSDMWNHRIRRIDSAGNITTVAGTGTAGFSGDGGPAVSAQLNQPLGLVVDCGGGTYFTDANNFRIRRIDNSGDIATILGTGAGGYGGDGGPSILATMSFAWGMVMDFYGDIYFADTTSSSVIRKITNPSIPSPTVNLAAGIPGSSSYGAGNTSTARFYDPYDVALDSSGNLFVADKNNHAIRRIDTCYSSPLKCLSAPSPTPGPTPDLAKLGFVLHPYPNSPNPFADSGTFLAFFVSESAEVNIDVYNVSGEKVRSFSSFSVKAGDTEFPWNARNDGGQLVASGVYLVRFKAVSTVSGKEQSQFLKCSVAR